MGDYVWTPITFDGVSLTAAPFRRVFFRGEPGPISSVESKAVDVQVVGLGSRDVRAQPIASDWELHCHLDGITQTKIESFSQVFSEDRGLVFFVANDGDATAYRVQCRVSNWRQVFGYPAYFIVRLHIPDPVWEANVLSTTGAALDNVSDSFNIGITNTGDRFARPIITINPDSKKLKDPNDDYTKAHMAFVVNRAPGAWNDLPIHMLDNNTADRTLDTATLIRDNATNGTLLPGINAGDTNMSFAGGHGFSNGGQMFIIDAGGGDAIEQVYGVLATNAVTGLIRGLGGTVDGDHGSGAVVNKSNMLRDQTDFKIWLAGRWINSFGGQIVEGNPGGNASDRLWANMTLPPRVKFSLKGDITTGIPASGGSIEVKEAIHLAPEQGLLSIGREMTWYNGRDIPGRKFTNIQRAVWYGANVNASDGDAVFANVVPFVFAYDRVAPGSFPRPAERIPILSALVSKNARWEYTNGKGAADFSFWDPTLPGRPGQWLPKYTKPHPDNNADALAFKTSVSGQLSWVDRVPIDSDSLIHSFVARFPQGIQKQSNAMVIHYDPDTEVRLRLIGRTARGSEVELADIWSHGGAASSITPDTTIELHELEVQAIRSAVTGNDGANVDETLSVSNVTRYQKVVLEHPTEVEALLLKIKKSGGGQSWTIQVFLYNDAGGLTDPSAGQIVAWFNRAHPTDAASDGDDDTDDTEVTTAYQTFDCGMFDGSTRKTVKLAAGTYWIKIIISDAPTGACLIQSGPVSTQNNVLFGGLDGALSQPTSNRVLWFRLIHKGAGPVQSESALFRTGNEAIWGKFGQFFTLEMNDVSAGPFTPQVDTFSAAMTDEYHCIGVLDNNENGDTLTIDVWLRTGWTLEIDCAKRTAVIIDGNMRYPVNSGITASNRDDWLRLEPGSNSIDYVEEGMVDTDFLFKWRGRKV